MIFFRLFLPIFIFSVVSCSDVPRREKFPGAEGATVGAASATSTQAVLGGFDPSKNNIPVEESESYAKAGTAHTLSGKINLKTKLSVKGKTLFLSLRPVAGGPPIAAIKKVEPVFPFEFSLSQKNVMIAGTPFEGEVVVKARLDSDGNAWTQDPKDLEATVKAVIGKSNNIILEL